MQAHCAHSFTVAADFCGGRAGRIAMYQKDMCWPMFPFPYMRSKKFVLQEVVAVEWLCGNNFSLPCTFFCYSLLQLALLRGTQTSITAQAGCASVCADVLSSPTV